MTPFPTNPGEVVALTVDEFVADLDLSSNLPLTAVCARFGEDLNRAVVWMLRYRALQHFIGYLDASRLEQTRKTATELAAGFTLNEDWEFERVTFLAAVEAARNDHHRGR